MTRQRLILASLLAAWVSILISCGGGGNSESRPRTGEEGYLYLPDNDKQGLLVAVDEEALDRLIEASVKHDKFGIAEVALTGTFDTPASTTAKAILIYFAAAGAGRRRAACDGWRRPACCVPAASGTT